MPVTATVTEAVGLRERKKARTREALGDAALELFARHGFDGTTVEEIAEACDVSPRTFFRYFPTKEDVLFGDSEQRCAALIAVLHAQPPELSPLAALHAAMRAMALDYCNERELLAKRSKVVQGSPNLRAYKLQHQRGWEDAVVEELTRRVRTAGTVVTPLEIRLLTSVSIAALRAALDTWLEDATGPDLESLLDQAFERVSRGLGPLAA
jgi:AcrR family transcriptional regulator